MECNSAFNNSRWYRFNLLTGMATALLLILCVPYMASAQMFSVQEEDQSFRFPQSSLYLGLEFADFEYAGRENALRAGYYEFEGPLIRVEIETSNIRLFMGAGGSITGMDSNTYFQAGLVGRYRFVLVDEEHFTLRVPVQLQSDITTVTNTAVLNVNSQFQQGALLFGTGVNLEIRPIQSFRMRIMGVPQTGISFSSGGTFGGSMKALELGARIYRDNAFGDIGITAGYSYKSRSYDIDREQFDYDLVGHTAMVGITF